ncbi:hypothetical protein FKP32DRAFT_37313 [Trametes sanguinea]|nr:hypothetical protein FKP32DRAFT_37313 [Trametes sanguinea]
MAPHIPSARKEDIVRTMSITGSSRKTAALLGVSQRACQRVVKRWREYHTVESPQPRSGRGRPRSLTTFDLEVSAAHSKLCAL